MNHISSSDSILWKGKWKSLKSPQYSNGRISLYIREPYNMSRSYVTTINISYEGYLNEGYNKDHKAIAKVWFIEGDDILKEKVWLQTIEMELPFEFVKYFITSVDSDKIEGFYVCKYNEDTGPFILYKS